MRNRRWLRKQTEYDSKWEMELHQGRLANWKFHPDRIKYTVVEEKTYQPDFVREDLKIMLECKGRFRDRDEANKYKHIRDSLPEGWRLIFLFQDAGKPMPFAKVRKKCGTKQSHGEWATKQGFDWYEITTIPKEWLQG